MQLGAKRIAVVGGANGIGAAVVGAFVREGASVAAVNIGDADGEAAVSEANERGGRGQAHYFHGDASDREEVKETFDSAAGVLGGFDVLAATVGVHNEALSESIDDDQFDRPVRHPNWNPNLGAGQTGAQTVGQVRMILHRAIVGLRLRDDRQQTSRRIGNDRPHGRRWRRARRKRETSAAATGVDDGYRVSEAALSSWRQQVTPLDSGSLDSPMASL